ncbi:hypothetical protein CCYA_CCYA14G3657 [Cyanidiococcus yangmingshanensis]|nr:hypothetical protein CCYA_CCYA14G3657 [Cyanidiococcus yangmingshanensis]
MAGKKAPAPKGKVAEEKKKKIVEDKTFGMKNKNKSKKVQRYVEQVQKQAEQMVGGPRKSHQTTEGGQRQSRKAAEAARQAELAQYFRPVPAGPKTQHLNDKVDLYTDLREQKAATAGARATPSETDMSGWVMKQLEEVIQQRHGTQNQQNTTQIVCRYFLDALEAGRYGWFWTCPNGGDKCPYRHALPAGFVLKKKRPEKEETGDGSGSTDAITIEDEIERERARISTYTPVTLERFLEWKERKRKEREERARQKRENALKRMGTQSASSHARHKVALAYGLSGRDLFEYRPELFVDDVNADETKYEERNYESSSESSFSDDDLDEKSSTNSPSAEGNEDDQHEANGVLAQTVDRKLSLADPKPDDVVGDASLFGG